MYIIYQPSFTYILLKKSYTILLWRNTIVMYFSVHTYSFHDLTMSAMDEMHADHDDNLEREDNYATYDCVNSYIICIYTYKI